MSLSRRAHLASGVLCASLTAPVLAQTQSQTEPLSLPRIEVIGISPLPGLGVPIQDVPANVQVFGGKDLRAQRSGSIADFLDSSATSVSVNAAQGNRFQPNVSFRGFTASPLLGLPQGLSVFQDGVRINEPFGDVVNWDLVPRSAIASVQLLPGSHPGFGLNTLGGALSVQTKSGLTHPGGSFEVQAGSFGRKTAEFEYGGSKNEWNYFVTAAQFQDRGWAEHNASRVQQFFGKMGYDNAQTAVNMSVTAAKNALEGSQTLPQSFSDNFRQAYTFPDRNSNRFAFVNVGGNHLINDHFFVDGNVYFRDYRNQNTSSNVDDDYDGILNQVQATNDRSVIAQRSSGAALQLTYHGNIAALKHKIVVGGNVDAGRAAFTQYAQDAMFTAARNTIGTGDFLLSTDAIASNRYDGLFINDTITLNDRWAATFSGRYNRATVKIRDQTGVASDLNGDHQFARWNSAMGVTFNPTPNFTAYATYNEGMRAPTPIELTCANPEAPCKLPNNFLSDPPLKMVLAKTVEIGMRGKAGESMNWSAALYRTQLQDDIQFISALGAGSNLGYFQNTGNSLRQGVELAATQRWGNTTASARYGHIYASYQSTFIVNSPANSTADANGNIEIRPGNRIPTIPRQTLKLRLSYDIKDHYAIAASVNHNSSHYARGNENNQSINGQSRGFTIANLDARMRIAHHLEIFANINNVFDRRYVNFATLGRNVFTGPSHTFDGNNPSNETFFGHGAPRGVWVGMRYEL
jgi:iron complex outermembrane recepter protein